MGKRKKCYLNLPDFAFFSKIFLVLLTIYDSADGNSFLQFLEAASSGAWGVQQKRLEYSRFAWIRLYSSKRRSVQERHSGDLACASHTSLKEWDRFRISREETAMQITWNAPFLYSMARVPPGCETAAVDTSSFRIKTAMTRLSCLHPALQMINWE